MSISFRVLTIALAASISPAWAATGNVDVYGSIEFGTLPTHEVYSAAATNGPTFFGSTFVPQTSITSTPGTLAQVTGAGYAASSRTTLGNNHAFASASNLPVEAFGLDSFSGWYDQVIVTGGTGTGVAQFTIQLSGTVDAGLFTGGAVYGLYASTQHPAQSIDSINIVDPVPQPTHPWVLDPPHEVESPNVTAIANYIVGASPYYDPSILFTTTPPEPDSGGAISVPFAPKIFANLVLTPGATQNVDVTLTGTFDFTYGEVFYLIGALTAGVYDGLEPFCVFAIDDSCSPPPKDGTGPTTLDFSNSAHLISIVLPEGSAANFASGTAYSVTTVPEPSEWLMLLTGLGLVGWRARRSV